MFRGILLALAIMLTVPCLLGIGGLPLAMAGSPGGAEVDNVPPSVLAGTHVYYVWYVKYCDKYGCQHRDGPFYSYAEAEADAERREDQGYYSVNVYTVK